MNRLIRVLALFVFILTSTGSYCQELADDTANRIQFEGRSAQSFERLFQAFNQLVLQGKGLIPILHLGDSHIQAGYLPDQVRQRLVSAISSGSCSRGLIFPYRIAHTNNPFDYRVKYTGQWESCRNVEYNKDCSLGLMGISVGTKDSTATISFSFRDPIPSDFNTLHIFHSPDRYSFSVDSPGGNCLPVKTEEEQPGLTRIELPCFLRDSVTVRFTRKDTLHSSFSLYGVYLDNGDPGIAYCHAGINGAEVTSFLRCNLLSEQLAMIRPELVIVSLGTNDAYPVKFDKELFISNYKELIRKLRKSDPNLPVLLTIPGDSYRKRRYVNKNLPILREAILEVATEMNCAVWDFYTVMGGQKSILKWYKKGLVAKDKLHFTRAGYVLQGDLLSDALLNAYCNFIDQKQQK
jgi:lysophospholipase L1-like esterase